MKNKKALGQHWLMDRGVLVEIAGLAARSDGGVMAGEGGVTIGGSGVMARTGVVVEIGPGLGTLTSALFKFFDEVIAIEFDGELARKLPGSFPGKKLTVLNRDVLGVDVAELPQDYVLAGNIPYYITSAIVRKFLMGERKPRKMVLLVQREVAERLAAGVGDYSILGLSAQIYAQVRLGPVVGREMFSPVPKVDSRVVILEPYGVPLAGESTMELIKLGFRAPRKKLVSNLAVGFGVAREEVLAVFEEVGGLGENVRPADLGIRDWVMLEKKIHKRYY